jgi:hypothetical protein
MRRTWAQTIVPGICLVCLVCLAASLAAADILPEPDKNDTWQKRLFEKYWNMQKPAATPKPAAEKPRADRDEFPGWILPGWTKAPEDLFRQKWPQRTQTYEVFFSSREVLARSIYGLALHTRDLDPTVDLARFEKGAGGFHYSIEEVAGWANAVLEGRQKVYTPEERLFLDRLVQDRVLVQVTGKYRNIGLVKHLLGVTPLGKRSLELNLNHERLHVRWDEDPAWRETQTARWKALTSAEKEAVVKSLKGYNPEDETKIMEEWVVRQNETEPNWYQ